MKKSFSLIELIIIIIVVGILYSSINVTLANTSLNQAADQIISHINYTRHLAIVDNKFQYYPTNSSTIEGNRSKYWFKQWWQIRISQKTSGEYFYEVFSDSPDFNRVGGPVSEYGLEPINKKYLAGNYNVDTADKKLKLTDYFDIKKILYNNIEVTSSIRLIFDNYGNVYSLEGKQGDGEDINPYDKNERKPLLQMAKITLCKDNNCEKNISICISPKIGNVYLCK